MFTRTMIAMYATIVSTAALAWLGIALATLPKGQNR